MIALFGGTFDPIHAGHLHLARCCLGDKNLTRFLFVPAARNPLKGEAPRATGLERLKMIELAEAEEADPRLGVLDWEVTRPGPSYTVETLERWHQEQSGEIPVLVMGNEVFCDLPHWKRPKRILALANILVITRETQTPDLGDVLRRVGIDFTPSPMQRGTRAAIGNRCVEIRQISPLPYSATQLRQALATDSNAMLPPPGIGRSVWRYIKENRLYSVRSR